MERDPSTPLANRHVSFPIGAPFLAALALVLAVRPAEAQQNPQFGQGFPRPGQSATQNPAEMGAYSAAINQSDPEAKASAIQQFLVNYPNSSLRQPAIAQMMLAKRGAPGAGAPSPITMNRPVMNQPAAVMSTPPASATAPVASMQPAGPPRDSLLQHPAKPALVTVAPHSLTVKADNSSLSQILHEISSSTGMKIDGLAQDDRIFGDYGPGDAREVLFSLLQGSGYNFLMVGNVNGAPRQLSLSQRTASTAVGAGQVNRSPRQEEDDSDDEIQQVPPPPEPQTAPGGSPQSADPNAQRNPAELQQEMLRLRQQEQQREQQQTQPPQPQPQPQ